ncbi:MAG: xanthan lyase [Bacteroidales bacterium]|nr:xanthan lyase [Bacteroidales bacterium]
MKSSKLIYLLLAGALAAGGGYITDVEASARKSKAKTTQTAKKKSSGSKKKRSSRATSKKKKGSKTASSTKKKTSATTKKRTTPKPQPPQETVSYDSLTLAVNSYVTGRIPEKMNPGGLRINSVKPDSRSRTAKVSLNENFTYLPVTQELIADLRKSVSEVLPDSLRGYSVNLSVGNRNLSYYITKVDKLPENHRKNIPFVVATEPYVNARKGMQGDILALWHSHGRYFRPASAAWMWQRGFLFETIEDTYTMSYMLPFIVPMVENAGGYVLLPRERDINRHEVIVDNDTNDEGEIYSQPHYREMNGARRWETGQGEGFIYDLPDFRDTENPFENGTYRQTTTIKSGSPSAAAWYADIPEDGEYAVYVSYKTLPNSTEDARYTVNYSGGSKEFKVNQTMGGGTWIYLGTFPLEAGYSDTEPVVTLSNVSDKADGRIVTADAVKIGGGMGNIARSARRSDVYYDPSTPDTGLALAQAEKEAQEAIDEAEEDDDDSSEDSGDDIDANDTPRDTSVPATPLSEMKKGPAPTFRTSGMPRYLEGARYWLQWAGMPERIYSPYHGADDYKDDYTSRGHWVNYLAGGSRVLPGREGLNIPIDMVLALHSDAGKRADDSFVGTLGIYYTNNGDTYRDGTARINSRMLTDMVMRQITTDIRQTFEPRWTRRSMWDKTYVEARVPEVPTTLIELMSHQNFADMQYGLDPAFRFMVGRAIYKAMGRFVAERKGREFVVQPLPVKDFAIQRIKKGHYRLSWMPTPDRLEPTAVATRYIIEERSGDELGFHKVGETTSTHFDIKTKDHEIHSFRVIAANEGGVAFAGETLALREGEDDKTPVMIINGFTRVSAPSHFSSEGRAGFNSEEDFGVPYIRDISFSGHQTEYRRGAGESFGRSASNYVDKVIAGNTFDYPYEHGKALAAAGRGFVSSSAGAVESGSVKLSDYKTVDLILGKQKMTVTGNGKSGLRFTGVPKALREALTGFTDKGGDLIVSGQYVASDLYDYRQEPDARRFASEILGIAMPADSLARTRSGRISATGYGLAPREYNYSSTLNDKIYIVEHPDVLMPSGELDTSTLLTFTDNGLGAGLLSRRGRSKVAVSSVPLEAITDENLRNSLIIELLEAVEED